VAQHSISLVDLTTPEFTLRLISLSGEDIDLFTITKAAR